MTGTASASTGRVMLLTYCAGFSLNGTQSRIRAGKMPQAPGTWPSHWISRIASQKDGVASAAMEMTRMPWSGQRSR
ncbi:Uncharacterised protein [Mycobacteroides abscessus subsp. abscessus]|nr:Uncharacterised protein [Mycobacteroides abscessus subsp. abscessus]